MAKNKQLKQAKQLKFDKMMIGVGIVSMLGGFLVFRGYAAQKIDTSKPQSISMSALKKQGIYYDLSFSKDLKYCFDSVQPRSKVTIYSEDSLSETHDISKGCFKPEKSYKSARTLITGVSANSQLLITKQ